MAIQKKCICCQKEFWGNRNKLFCSDACRKYASRHPELNSSQEINSDLKGAKIPIIPSEGHGKSAQIRTSGGRIFEYAAKKLIDIAADSLTGQAENRPISKAETPLEMTPIKFEKSIPGNFAYLLNLVNTPKLSSKMKDFLGDLTLPFQILLWGTPGQGKSTFSMILANELSDSGDLLIVAGEEHPSLPTFQRRVNSIFSVKAFEKVHTVSRLPTKDEWPSIINGQGARAGVKFLIYDSINVLAMHSDHGKSLKEQKEMAINSAKLGHIYISQAQKDGKSYAGNASWGHEVDIIIKVLAGKAIIEKNRFANDTQGGIGKEYLIF